MFEIPLHTGTQHPDLVWILVPTILSFVAGLGLGAISDRVRDWLQLEGNASSTDR